MVGISPEFASNTQAAMDKGKHPFSGKFVPWRITDERVQQILDSASSYEEAKDTHYPNIGKVAATFQYRGRERDALEDRFAVTQTSERRSIKNVPEFLRKHFDAIDHAITEANTPGGSTANVVYISADPARTITIANTGDSHVHLLIRDVSTGKIEPYQLSYSHNLPSSEHEYTPKDREESIRITNAGGRIGGGRVLREDAKHWLDSSVAMTRAFGDKRFPGITHTPDITQVTVAAEVNDPTKEVYVINASDAVGKLMYALAAEEIEHYLGIGPVPDAKKKDLAKFIAVAGSWGSTDDCTINVIEVTKDQKNDIIAGVFDGHGGSQVAELAADYLKRIALEAIPDPAPAQIPSHSSGSTFGGSNYTSYGGGAAPSSTGSEDKKPDDLGTKIAFVIGGIFTTLGVALGLKQAQAVPKETGKEENWQDKIGPWVLGGIGVAVAGWAAYSLNKGKGGGQSH